MRGITGMASFDKKHQVALGGIFSSLVTWCIATPISQFYCDGVVRSDKVLLVAGTLELLRLSGGLFLSEITGVGYRLRNLVLLQALRNTRGIVVDLERMVEIKRINERGQKKTGGLLERSLDVQAKWSTENDLLEELIGFSAEIQEKLITLSADNVAKGVVDGYIDGHLECDTCKLHSSYKYKDERVGI